MGKTVFECPVPVGVTTNGMSLLATAAALTVPTVPGGAAVCCPRDAAGGSDAEVVTPTGAGPTVELGGRRADADENEGADAQPAGHVVAVWSAVLQVRHPSTRSLKHSAAICPVR